MNLNRIKRQLDEQLSAIIPEPSEVIAERNLLLKHFLGISIEILHTDPYREIELTESLESLLNSLQRRVKERIPIQYLLGEAIFYGLSFKVSPDVLIPRSETELIVEIALDFYRHSSFKRVLDLGTGSGCIAISLKKHLPALDVTAIDISPEALEIAICNAKKHQTPIRFLEGSWTEPLPENEKFDLIVSNPPYILASDRAALAPELMHEPHEALFIQEEDSLTSSYKIIIAGSIKHLSQQGAILLEIGINQAPLLTDLADKMGLKSEIYKDYAGIERVMKLKSKR